MNFNNFKNFILNNTSTNSITTNVNEVELHDTLNTKLWDNNKLHKEVDTGLKAIADNFITFLQLPKDLVKDILFTGSNANYNYHAGSDIDIHIEIDDSAISCLDSKNYFIAKKTLWNEQHDIKVYGYDVELYAEKSEEHPVTNAGVYSLMKNKWLKEPIKVSIDNIDTKAINTKANDLKERIDSCIASKTNNMKSLDKLKETIRVMRATGISTSGEYSVENLAFKVLRDDGYLQKLSDYVNNVEDNNLSIK
jgi:hypothetical protein